MSWCWVVVVVVVVVVAVVVDVVDVVVVVVAAVARCFVGAHARRARARQTSPQILTLLARARAPTYAERMFGSPQTKPKPWYLRCFCSKRENKN